jgi:hypothetical protein
VPVPPVVFLAAFFPCTGYLNFRISKVDVVSAEHSVAISRELLKERNKNNGFNELPLAQEIDAEDDIYTTADFMDCVNTNSFIDYDGFGYYAIPPVMYPSKVVVIPSEMKKNGIDPLFTHVVWFNR